MLVTDQLAGNVEVEMHAVEKQLISRKVLLSILSLQIEQWQAIMEVSVVEGGYAKRTLVLHSTLPVSIQNKLILYTESREHKKSIMAFLKNTVPDWWTDWLRVGGFFR